MTSNEQLPTWEACADKRNSGKSLTALEEFIFDNEPAPNPRSTEEDDFRSQLLAVLIEQRAAHETAARKTHVHCHCGHSLDCQGIQIPEALPSKDPSPEWVLKARAQGRAEALELITSQGPESFMDDCIGEHAIADTGDYDTHWNTQELRKLLKVDDEASSLIDRADCAYWSQQAEIDNLKDELKRRPTEDTSTSREILALRWLAESADPDKLTGRFAVDHARHALGLARLERSPVETSERHPTAADVVEAFRDAYPPEKASARPVPACGNPVMINAERYRGCVLPSGHDGDCSPRKPSSEPMPMLPNEHHPGPRCSCAACLTGHPEKASAPQCIWKTGCKHPEVCKANLRCVPGGIEGKS